MATSVPATSSARGIEVCEDLYGWGSRSSSYGTSKILIDGEDAISLPDGLINIPQVTVPKMVKRWSYSLSGHTGMIYEIRGVSLRPGFSEKPKKTSKGTMACVSGIPFYGSRFLIVDDQTGLVDMNHDLVIHFVLGQIALPLVHTDGILRDLSFTTGTNSEAVISVSPRESSAVIWKSSSHVDAQFPCFKRGDCVNANDPAKTIYVTTNSRYDWGEFPRMTENFGSRCFDPQSASSMRKTGEDYPGIFTRQGVSINLIWTSSGGFEDISKSRLMRNRPFIPFGGFGIGSNSVCGIGYAGSGIDYDPITWAAGRFDLNLIAPPTNYRGDPNPLHLSIVMPSRLLSFWGVPLNDLSTTSLIDFRVNGNSTAPSFNIISDRAVLVFDNIPSDLSPPYSATLPTVSKSSVSNAVPSLFSAGSRVSLRVKSMKASARSRALSTVLPKLEVTARRKLGVTLAVSGAVKNCSYTFTWKNKHKISYLVKSGIFNRSKSSVKIELPAALSIDRGTLDLFGICTGGRRNYIRGTIAS